MEVQPVSDQVVSFLWAGQEPVERMRERACAPEGAKKRARAWKTNQTWSFRSALDAADIRGAYYESSTEGGDSATSGRTYYRTIQIDLSGETGKKINDIISEVFHNLAMRVKVRHAPEESSAVAGIIAELRELDNLHFEDDL